jgi:ABC-type nickel/cobalt efflux system permease component RcnA
MPLKKPADGCTAVAALVLLAAASVVLMSVFFDTAWAQGSAFGPPRTAAASGTGILGWMFAKQAAFYREMSGIIRQAKTDGTAVWALLGISFLYGIFHAVGPGHGKAVISSYLVANEETWRRGVVLSFASAILQAFVAVVIVGVAAALLNATAGQICSAERVVEMASYALIVLIGLRLLWVKGRGFLRAASSLNRPLHAVGAAVTPPHEHDHRHDHHHHSHDHDHHHHHDDDHASAWGHAHGPEPQDLAGPGGWRRGLSAIVAVGLRPCSGAIIVLVFALAQGLFWTGVAATFMMGLGTAVTVAAIATMAVWGRSAAARLAGARSGYGMLAMRGIEVGAAVVVLAFGALLLTGYMVAERGACF